MLLLYAFKEAYQSLYTHKSRTFSMGFGILWAIFILVLLLGAGNGFHNSASQRFARFGKSTMFIWGANSAGRWVPIPLEIARNFPERFRTSGHAAPVLGTFSRPGVRYKEKRYSYCFLAGVEHGYAILSNISMNEGRFFTAHDEAEASNLCIITSRIKEALFGKASTIGKCIRLGSSTLQVVGVLDECGIRENIVFLTHTFFKKSFPMACHTIGYMHFSLLSTAKAAVIEAQCRAYLARHLNVDANSIHLWNVAQMANKLHNFFKTISIVIWIIGICFLITGMVTMSNMMLVTIQERTQEIAIRRVLGGRSKEIMAMIIYEVAIVTFIAGMIGFVAGFTFLQLLNQWVIPLFKSYHLANLTCPPEVILGGLGLTLLTSCLASIIPAIRAVKIKPVAALSS